MFDAHRIPSRRDLESVVRAVNRDVEQKIDSSNNGNDDMINEIKFDDKGWPHTRVQSERYHGNNPHGVGISSPLTLVPSKAFSSLQSQTEEKTKYYGCICYTSTHIESNDELISKLGCKFWDKEGDSGKTNYPLEIKQHTPLRVLHRRSSDIRTRYILSMSANRINDHWFRLRMCTSAGTYVKEFCHGDCGRTYPSIASMIGGGGRVDITELDCEEPLRMCTSAGTYIKEFCQVMRNYL